MVYQGCLLYRVLFNIFLENIMEKALDEFQTSISIGERTVFRLADDIDMIRNSQAKPQKLTSKLEQMVRTYETRQHGCENWTFTAGTKRWIQSFEKQLLQKNATHIL